MIDPQKTETSPIPSRQGIFKYSENTILPVKQLINAKHAATNITGTVAKPSKPSVKLTALEDPTIIKTENGIKNHPRLIIKSLKKGKYKFVSSVF